MLHLLMILRTVDRGVTGLLLPLDVDAEVEGGDVPARPSQQPTGLGGRFCPSLRNTFCTPQIQNLNQEPYYNS